MRFRNIPNYVTNRRLAGVVLLICGIFALSIAIAAPAEKLVKPTRHAVPIAPLGIFKMML